MNIGKLEINGIKCDNPVCNYVEEGISVDNLSKWLNRPCPCCGENLLTKVDFTAIQDLMAVVENLNKNAPANNIDEPRLSTKLIMNGNGLFKIKNITLL